MPPPGALDFGTNAGDLVALVVAVEDFEGDVAASGRASEPDIAEATTTKSALEEVFAKRDAGLQVEGHRAAAGRVGRGAGRCVSLEASRLIPQAVVSRKRRSMWGN